MRRPTIAALRRLLGRRTSRAEASIAARQTRTHIALIWSASSSPRPRPGTNRNPLVPSIVPGEVMTLTREMISLVRVVGLTGFEPATPCPPDKCATKLRYSPLLRMTPTGSPDRLLDGNWQGRPAATPLCSAFGRLPVDSYRPSRAHRFFDR